MKTDIRSSEDIPIETYQNLSHCLSGEARDDGQCQIVKMLGERSEVRL